MDNVSVTEIIGDLYVKLYAQVKVTEKLNQEIQALRVEREDLLSRLNGQVHAEEVPGSVR